MKKTWTQPVANVQLFVANEYVAACWGVTCNVPADKPYGSFTDNGVVCAYDSGAHNSGMTHRAGFCGDPSHYQIELNDNGVPMNMVEVKTDKLGDLPCTITDSHWNPKGGNAIAEIKQGELIYWTTSASGNRTWHHYGTVSGTYNHS